MTPLCEALCGSYWQLVGLLTAIVPYLLYGLIFAAYIIAIITLVRGDGDDR